MFLKWFRKYLVPISLNESSVKTREASVHEFTALYPYPSWGSWKKGLNFETARIVIKDANTLLATAKNSEGGGGHGH